MKCGVGASVRGEWRGIQCWGGASSAGNGSTWEEWPLLVKCSCLLQYNQVTSRTKIPLSSEQPPPDFFFPDCGQAWARGSRDGFWKAPQPEALPVREKRHIPLGQYEYCPR